MWVTKELLRLVAETTRYAIQSRRIGVLALVLFGSLAVTVAMAVGLAAPAVLYPLL